MSNHEREQVRQLTWRLKELFRKAGSSEFMTSAQRAELFSITKKLGSIYDKYDTRRRWLHALAQSSWPTSQPTRVIS